MRTVSSTEKSSSENKHFDLTHGHTDRYLPIYLARYFRKQETDKWFKLKLHQEGAEIIAMSQTTLQPKEIFYKTRKMAIGHL